MNLECDGYAGCEAPPAAAVRGVAVGCALTGPAAAALGIFAGVMFCCACSVRREKIVRLKKDKAAFAATGIRVTFLKYIDRFRAVFFIENF